MSTYAVGLSPAALTKTVALWVLLKFPIGDLIAKSPYKLSFIAEQAVPLRPVEPSEPIKLNLGLEFAKDWSQS